MLNVERFNKLCQTRKMSTVVLSEYIVRGGLGSKTAKAAIKNWQKGLLKPQPSKEEISQLAGALGVEVTELSSWRSSYRFAPGSARKARLVTELIVGRRVQDAMDVLKFTHKRAASMIDKVLKAAVANADEQQADVDKLYVSEAHVDDAGVRIGTKRWIPKDRGRAHPIRKKACHIQVTVSEI